MATVKITNDEHAQFRNIAQTYINRNPDRTPLHYALEKVLKKNLNKFEDYADKENDIRAEYALKDKETKKFVFNDDKRTFAVDPDRAKEMTKKLRELSREEVELEVHFATELPDHIDALWQQHFIGIVMNDPMEPKEVKELKLEKVND
jgi:hypothetical protein